MNLTQTDLIILSAIKEDPLGFNFNLIFRKNEIKILSQKKEGLPFSNEKKYDINNINLKEIQEEGENIVQKTLVLSPKLKIRIQYVPAYPNGFDFYFKKINMQEIEEFNILEKILKNYKPLYSDNFFYYNR